ncbi:guanosine-3',5'-bis(diphosphate) 3'-pyrophosphohydrolase MESH1 [Stomoxys calcitrans]|uniref:Guanosine-3',5'-bis(diphosphate) 3'-pyrophosphohydrolase MESH1 n=1 Tax=Stomoxys calcitrans TaxID=35570 RepID=A0A1I8Q115_STOCA|nr:guanosine-3',5'-bis(diphosphate) 3'-pyrophosphohydrolase MESH1 [Stomoxys calcitrans]
MEMELFMKCLKFAAHKHRNQRRKNLSETPYINHPINVAFILSGEAHINDNAVLMAALLHDTVEDTDTTFNEIENLFGPEVCSIVREVTDDKSLPKDVRKQLQIEHASNSSMEAKLVKLADKLDNLRDLQTTLPNSWTEERREHYFIWAKKVVDNLRGTNIYLEAQLDDVFRARKMI